MSVDLGVRCENLRAPRRAVNEGLGGRYKMQEHNRQLKRALYQGHWLVVCASGLELQR